MSASSNAAKSHPTVRAHERHGIVLSHNDLQWIARMIREGRATRLTGYPIAPPNEGWVLTMPNGPRIAIVYDPVSTNIVTVLPPEYSRRFGTNLGDLLQRTTTTKGE